MNKYRVVSRLQKYLANPVSKLVAGIVGPALLETTGRKTGKKRRTPVGASRSGDSFFIVTEHGRRAGYVRNIGADPHVRIKHHGRWHDGVAHVLPDEEPRHHLRGVNGLVVRLVGTELLVVRIDV
jgi:deazaflavin-dependent oxidoreductase (nitroreductase family)